MCALAVAISAQGAGPIGLRVAIYSGTGAESDKTLALYRAVAACGHLPLAVTKSDLVNGRLTPANFSIFIIPAGEGGEKCCANHFSDIDAIGGGPAEDAMRAFANSGGGIVALEAGAYLASKNGGTLDLYQGNYTWTRPAPGKQTFSIVDPAFGGGAQEAWMSYGGGYFPSVPAGATVVARDRVGQPVVVRSTFGAGRVALSAATLELRGDSLDDWTIWDNWAMDGAHSNSIGAWKLLGRLINWTAHGDSSEPVLNPAPWRGGARVAVVATHTGDGGAWPGLLPAVARAIEFSGHVPLAIRFDEIHAGRLALANFQVVTFPGGYAYGYKAGLAGAEQKIRDFLNAGGSYYGICAGSFYAPATIQWEGRRYDYPLAIYKGQDIGAISDLAPWPSYVLTPIRVNDTVLGDLGVIREMYYGGGYHTIPSEAEQGAPVFTSATFAYGGTAAGQPDVVRYRYGAGRVLLVTTHSEARAGSDADWLFWDNFANDSTTPVTNPDNPWRFVSAAFNRWLVPAPPPLRITSVERLADGRAKLRHAGAPGLSYTVEASTNLVSWSPTGLTRDHEDGAFEFIETNTPAARAKFFRLRGP